MKKHLVFLCLVGFGGLFITNSAYGAKNLLEKNDKLFSKFTFAAVAPNGKYAVEGYRNGGKQVAMVGGPDVYFDSKEENDLYNSIVCLWQPYKITFILPYSDTELEEIKKKIDEDVTTPVRFKPEIDTKRKIITSKTQGHIREKIRALVFSPNSQYLASAGRFDEDALLKKGKDEKGKEVYIEPEYTTQDVPVKIWGVNVSKQRLFLSKVLKGQKDSVSYLAFSADGKRLASVGSKIITWNVETGNIISEKKATVNAYSMDLSPDGKILAVGEKDDKSIRIYDADTGEEIKKLTGYDKEGINSLAFSSDGKFLASAGRLKKDKTIIIWNTTDWSSTMIPQAGHKDYIIVLAFSPDGKYLASGDEKDNICIWETESGKLLETLGKDIVGSLDSKIHFSEKGELIYYDGKNVEIKRIKSKSISKED